MSDTQAIAAARSGIEAWKAGQAASPLEAVCPIRGVLDKLGDKWSMLVILELSAGEQLMTFHVEVADHLQYGHLQFDLVGGTPVGGGGTGGAAGGAAQGAPRMSVTSWS